MYQEEPIISEQIWDMFKIDFIVNRFLAVMQSVFGLDEVFEEEGEFADEAVPARCKAGPIATTLKYE